MLSVKEQLVIEKKNVYEEEVFLRANVYSSTKGFEIAKCVVLRSRTCGRRLGGSHAVCLTYRFSV